MADASATQTQIPSFSFLGSMHEGIPVDDANLDACIKFYTEVLGLKLLKRPKALDDIGRGAWLGDMDDKVLQQVLFGSKIAGLSSLPCSLITEYCIPPSSFRFRHQR